MSPRFKGMGKSTNKEPIIFGKKNMSACTNILFLVRHMCLLTSYLWYSEVTRDFKPHFGSLIDGNLQETSNVIANFTVHVGAQYFRRIPLS